MFERIVIKFNDVKFIHKGINLTKVYFLRKYFFKLNYAEFYEYLSKVITLDIFKSLIQTNIITFFLTNLFYLPTLIILPLLMLTDGSITVISLRIRSILM